MSHHRCYHLVWITNEVRDLINVGAWRQLFEIDEPMSKELALEVLVTFSLNWGHSSLNRPTMIEFKVDGGPYMIGYIEFPLRIGLYHEDYI